MSTAQSGHEAAGAAGANVAARRPPTTAESLFDLSRGRQATLSIAQPGLAAVLAAGGMPGARVVAIGLVAAWAGFFAVFSLNDVLDRRVDAAALRAGKAEVKGYDLDAAFLRHPLAQGAVTLRLSLLWVAGLALVAAVGAWLLGPLCLALFGAAVALEVLYCGLRSVTWVKTVISGVMVGCGGLAGWAAVAPLALGRPAGVRLPRALGDRVPQPRQRPRRPRAGPRRRHPHGGHDLRSGGRRARQPRRRGGRARDGAVPRPRWPGRWPWRWPSGALLVAWPAVRLYREPTSARAGWYFNLASLYPAAVLLAAVGAWAAGRL